MNVLLVSALHRRRHIQHDDVIKWEDFPRYWPFVRGIHRSPVNSPHKGQWRRALTFSLICARTNAWVNKSEAGDLRRHRAHYDAIVMGNMLQYNQYRNYMYYCGCYTDEARNPQRMIYEREQHHSPPPRHIAQTLKSFWNNKDAIHGPPFEPPVLEGSQPEMKSAAGITNESRKCI